MMEEAAQRGVVEALDRAPLLIVPMVREVPARGPARHASQLPGPLCKKMSRTRGSRPTGRSDV
jgi:hypothetical protein